MSEAQRMYKPENFQIVYNMKHKRSLSVTLIGSDIEGRIKEDKKEGEVKLTVKEKVTRRKSMLMPPLLNKLSLVQEEEDLEQELEERFLQEKME